MEAFLVSLAAVAIGEIGDRTQLLAIVLGARYQRPLEVILGVFVATLANHAIAGLLGNWVQSVVSAEILRWLLAASFFAIALWTLKPDRLTAEAASSRQGSAFLVTVVGFFLAEMGDKTQLATVALAARFDDLVAVIMGTTCGMLLADVPVILLGAKGAPRLPLNVVRTIAAGIFTLAGLATLLYFPEGIS